jgi:hypothetical protein
LKERVEKKMKNNGGRIYFFLHTGLCFGKKNSNYFKYNDIFINKYIFLVDFFIPTPETVKYYLLLNFRLQSLISNNLVAK